MRYTYFFVSPDAINYTLQGVAEERGEFPIYVFESETHVSLLLSSAGGHVLFLVVLFLEVCTS